jgi:hypothetical protein
MIRLTAEQHNFAEHLPGVFVEACPGAGKTRTIVERIARIVKSLPPRRGIAVLSFTNSAIEEFIIHCHNRGLDFALRHPGFVGTFDSFLRQFFFSPGGIEGVPIRPSVLDCWETLGIDVRLRGANAYRGEGVGLDLFDAETNEIDPTLIGYAGLRAHVQGHKDAYQRAAGMRRHYLRCHGYLSAADVRVDVVQRLQNAGWAIALGRVLAARFKEIIVDEAQDCNTLDCRIVNWLRQQGVTVTVVADPDQAIYGFRHGPSDILREIAGHYATQNRLSLTGNFRCSPSICGVAATLRHRATPDLSLGDTADVTEPVHVLVYQGNSVTEILGRFFGELMDAAGICRKEGIILSHIRKNALRACGSCSEDDAGDSKTAKIARVVGSFWLPSASNRVRELALQSVERMILELMGMIDGGEIPSRAADKRGIDRRWLRRSALELISHIPRNCDSSQEARSAWVAVLRQQVHRLDLKYKPGTSENRYFIDRNDACWNNLLTTGNEPEFACATIHEAKGREYSAVCVVIPPDSRDLRRTEQLFVSWSDRTDDEAKRVIYVAITRAKKLGAVAIPSAYRDRLSAILEANQTDWQEHLV